MRAPGKQLNRFTFLLLLSVVCHAQVGPYVRHLAQGATYYISPSGNDANPGTQASPWASPNHALNCGDVIYAVSGAYNEANFQSGKWGTVTCGSGNHLVWLIATTFDASTISAGAHFGMYVDKSYWGVQGWEVTTSASGFTGFAAAPPSGATASIHHIVFANDVVNGAGGGGFGTFSVGNFGVDYVAIVGNIAYNASQNSLNCYSGISIFEPVAADSVAGTHIYIAGNFSYLNLDPNTCAGGPATDGDGGILDTFNRNGSGGGGTILYDKQAAMDNNMFLANGGYGMERQDYQKNPASTSIVHRAHNTLWGNNTTVNRNVTSLCAESLVNLAYGVIDTANLIQSTRSSACATTNTLRASTKYDTTNASGSSDSGNWYFTSSGSNTSTFNDDGGTFAFGTNTTGTNPAFAAPSAPSAPSCGTSSSVVDCMSTVIANFTPTALGSTAYGYQAPLTVNGSDPYFPAWLCSAGVPGGLVTFSC